MAKKVVDWAETLVRSRQDTRQIPAGVSGNPVRFQTAISLVAAMPEVTVALQVLPPSVETSTLTVSLENPPPAVQTSGTAPFVAKPASPKDAVLSQGEFTAMLASSVPPQRPILMRPPLGEGSLV